MSTPATGTQRAGPPAAHRALGLPVLVLLVGLALGYWTVSALTTPPQELPEGMAGSGYADDGRAGVLGASDRNDDQDDPPASGTQDPGIDLPETASPERFTELTGLEVLWVAVSGSGGIIDLRYRAVDEDTASAHARHNHGAGIIDSKTGTYLTAQWMGHAHPPNAYQPDRNYWMLFSNPNELVKSGDLVSVQLSHAVLTGVRVR